MLVHQWEACILKLIKFKAEIYASSMNGNQRTSSVKGVKYFVKALAPRQFT
jgi:hypothetical protein